MKWGAAKVAGTVFDVLHRLNRAQFICGGVPQRTPLVESFFEPFYISEKKNLYREMRCDDVLISIVK